MSARRLLRFMQEDLLLNISWLAGLLFGSRGRLSTIWSFFFKTGRDFAERSTAKRSPFLYCYCRDKIIREWRGKKARVGNLKCLFYCHDFSDVSFRCVLKILLFPTGDFFNCEKGNKSICTFIQHTCIGYKAWK